MFERIGSVEETSRIVKFLYMIIWRNKKIKNISFNTPFLDNCNTLHNHFNNNKCMLISK